MTTWLMWIVLAEHHQRMGPAYFTVPWINFSEVHRPFPNNNKAFTELEHLGLLEPAPYPRCPNSFLGDWLFPQNPIAALSQLEDNLRQVGATMDNNDQGGEEPDADPTHQPDNAVPDEGAEFAEQDNNPEHRDVDQDVPPNPPAQRGSEAEVGVEAEALDAPMEDETGTDNSAVTNSCSSSQMYPTPNWIQNR